MYTVYLQYMYNLQYTVWYHNIVHFKYCDHFYMTAVAMRPVDNDGWTNYLFSKL